MAIFENIVRRLKIPGDFLATYSAAVREKLREASRKLASEKSRMDGINQCLHLASSVVLRNPEHLDEALEFIPHALGAQRVDPTTVLTVAALYYLLQYETHRLKTEEADDRQAFRQVQREFDAKDWLIGREVMGTLGIEPVNP